MLWAIAFKTEFLLAPDHNPSNISIKTTHKSNETPESSDNVGSRDGGNVGLQVGAAVMYMGALVG
jgi:hypothetical protein